MTQPDSNKQRLLFVCAGNICRSPLAEGIFLHILAQRGLSTKFEIDSAATGAWHIGAEPDKRSIAAARKHGVNLPSVARQVQPRDFERFDLILCMDEENLRNLKQVSPAQHHDKIRLIRKYDQSAKSYEVPDPYYGDSRNFEEVFEMLDRACTALVNHLSGEKSEKIS